MVVLASLCLAESASAKEINVTIANSCNAVVYYDDYKTEAGNPGLQLDSIKCLSGIEETKKFLEKEVVFYKVYLLTVERLICEVEKEAVTKDTVNITVLKRSCWGLRPIDNNSCMLSPCDAADPTEDNLSAWRNESNQIRINLNVKSSAMTENRNSGCVANNYEGKPTDCMRAFLTAEDLQKLQAAVPEK